MVLDTTTYGLSGYQSTTLVPQFGEMKITFTKRAKKRIEASKKTNAIFQRWAKLGEGKMSVRTAGRDGYTIKYTAPLGHTFVASAHSIEQLNFALKTGGPSMGDFKNLISPEESLAYPNMLEAKRKAEAQKQDKRPAWLRKLMWYLPPYSIDPMH